MDSVNIKNKAFDAIAMTVFAVIFFMSMQYFYIKENNAVQISGSATISIGLSMIGLGIVSYIIRPFLKADRDRKYHLITSALGVAVMLTGCLVYFLGTWLA